MRAAFYIACAATALLAGLVVALKAALRKVRREMQAELDARFAEGELSRSEATANFFGLESLGPGQFRGNGALALSGERLWFMLCAPRREVDIPLNTIAAVGVKRSHLGKTCLGKLLCVEFDNGGTPDSAAWAVFEPEAWVRAIDRARGATEED